MNDLLSAAIYATLAGATIPLGALVARVERIQPRWLEQELRHSIIALGGGLLLAAIALVLVPVGSRHLPLWAILATFGAGGLAFFVIERAIERHGGAAAQSMAMLLDFVPESLAMGAMLATETEAGLLLALLIALQNFPEAFNAYRELKAGVVFRPAVVLAAFSLLVLLGPLAAVIGGVYLSSSPEVLGAVMLFAAGGILYLTFEAIAPQAYLRRHWAPPLGAVVGFMLGLLGRGLIE